MLISQHVESIFHEALKQPPHLREEFLGRVCGDDTSFRREIELLLQYAEESTGFFQNFAKRINKLHLNGDPSRASENIRIGSWSLLSLLGSGGMGNVYLAERADHHYTQRVALKILPRGADDPIARFRFASERKILAQLDHKGIARFIDGGVTENGTQYFAMEYVNGTDIKSYCHESDLSYRVILNLFIDICEAVQYAHDHLVIHRDLKPSNVLVDEAGEVKLLDFGIAKMVEVNKPDIELTQAASCPITMSYASPEMLQGKSVTIATDVYSLGVMLYELLTGSRPYEISEPGIGRQFAHFDGEPRLASRMTDDREFKKTLRGDLDAILVKAIRIDSELRYGSVREMASDIRCYLDGFPIKAKTHNTFYYISKFIARHRSSSTAIFVALFSLCFSAFLSTYHMLEAQNQRDLAQLQQRRAQTTNNFLNLIMEEIGPGGRPMTLEELLDHGVSVLDQTTLSNPGLSGQILFELSRSYGQLGIKKKKEALLKKAESAASQAKDTDLLSTILCVRADDNFLDNPQFAIDLYRTAHQAMTERRNYSIDNKVHCAMAKASLLEHENRSEEALSLIQETLDALNQASSAAGNLHFVLINKRTLLLYSLGRKSEVLDSNSETLSLMEQQGRRSTIGYMVEGQNRAILLNMMGEISRYVELCRQLIDSFSSKNRLSQRPNKFVMRYADSLLRLGKYGEALALYQENIEKIREEGNHLYVAHHQLGMGKALLRLGDIERAQEKFANAERRYLNSPVFAQRKLNWITLERAAILRIQGQYDGAMKMIESLLKKLGYPDNRDGFQLSQALRNAASTALHLPDVDIAERYVEDFLETARHLARAEDTSADVGYGLLLRAKLSLNQDKRKAALEDLHKAIGILSSSAGREHPDTVTAVQLLNELDTGISI